MKDLLIGNRLTYNGQSNLHNQDKNKSIIHNTINMFYVGRRPSLMAKYLLTFENDTFLNSS